MVREVNNAFAFAMPTPKQFASPLNIVTTAHRLFAAERRRRAGVPRAGLLGIPPSRAPSRACRMARSRNTLAAVLASLRRPLGRLAWTRLATSASGRLQRLC